MLSRLSNNPALCSLLSVNVAFALLLNTSGNAKTIYKRSIIKSKTRCGSSVKFVNCDKDDDEMVSFSRARENKLAGLYKPGKLCDKINFVLYNFKLSLANGSVIEYLNYTNKETFIIEPYMIGVGKHTIVFFIRENSDDNEVGVDEDECKFLITPEIPVPVITGGSQVTVESNEMFKVSGAESIDTSIPFGQPDRLIFRWSCTVEEKKTDFCDRDLGRDATIVVPAKYALNHAKYKFTLFVKNDESDWQNATQAVYVETNSITIAIRCLKNCPPLNMKTNSKAMTVLLAECIRNCGTVKQDSYFWTVDKTGFDYSRDTQDGRLKNTLFIKPNTLKPNEKYNIQVTYKGPPSGRAAIYLNIHAPPVLKSCYIQPTSGEALKTLFRVTCDYDSGIHKFEIYSLNQNADVMLESAARLEEIKFLLSPGSKVKVKIIDQFQFSDEKVLDVSVTSALSSESNAKERLEKIFDKEDSSESLDHVLKVKRFPQALQIINAVSDEISKKPRYAAVFAPYHRKIFKLFEKIPEDKEKLSTQAGIAEKISKTYLAKPDPAISQAVTNVCEKSARINLAALKKERFPASFLDRIKTDAEFIQIFYSNATIT